jgi:hypothetical protein
VRFLRFSNKYKQPKVTLIEVDFIMSERNSSSFDYEFTGSTLGATEFNDGDRLDTHNPYRTEGLKSYKIGHEAALAAATRVRPERLPTASEQTVMHIEGLAERVESLRANATQADLELAGGEQ